MEFLQLSNIVNRFYNLVRSRDDLGIEGFLEVCNRHDLVVRETADHKHEDAGILKYVLPIEF